LCLSRKSKTNEKIIKPDDTEFDCETHISDRRSKQKHRIKSKKKPLSIKQISNDNNNSSRARTPLERLFNKTKKVKTPSPTPSSIINIPEEDHDDTASSLSSSMSSDWSTTTYPDSHSSEKSTDLVHPLPRRQSMPLSNLTNRNDELKHRSCVESFYLGREHVRQTSLPPPSQIQASLPKLKEERNTNKRNEIKSPAKSKQVLQNVRNMMKDQNIQEQHFNDTQKRESVRL
jgi:hypothetical protein